MKTDIKTLLGTQPEDLAELQYATLKEYAIEQLTIIISLLKSDSLNVIQENHLFDSPSGDGWGKDNRCICFDGCGYEDMGAVVNRLAELRELKKAKVF